MSTALADPSCLQTRLRHPVDPVGAIDVGAAGRPEHRGVARCAPAVAVRGRILVVACLDLDDRSAGAFEEQRDADQVGRDLVDAAGEELAADRA
jgi:hypothetical protein